MGLQQPAREGNQTSSPLRSQMFVQRVGGKQSKTVKQMSQKHKKEKKNTERIPVG